MFLVTSDRSAFAEAWAPLLGPENMRTATALADTLAMVATQRFPLTILDASRLSRQSLAPDGDVARLARHTRLLLADADFDEQMEVAALSLGIVGCCQPRLSPTELRKIVEVVLKGGIWVSRNALPYMLNHLRHATQPAEPGHRPQPAPRQLDRLTPREREIAARVAEGESNKVIAKHLNVSDVTVKAHLTTIFHKLGVSGRVQLALLLSDMKRPSAEPPHRAA